MHLAAELEARRDGHLRHAIPKTGVTGARRMAWLQMSISWGLQAGVAGRSAPRLAGFGCDAIGIAWVGARGVKWVTPEDRPCRSQFQLRYESERMEVLNFQNAYQNGMRSVELVGKGGAVDKSRHFATYPRQAPRFAGRTCQRIVSKSTDRGWVWGFAQVVLKRRCGNVC